MVENILDEETDTKGVDGRRLRARRGTLGDHTLMTAPKYCGKWLVDENKRRRVKHPYHKQIRNKRSGDCNFLQGGISYAIRYSSYTLSVLKLMFLMMIHNN